MSYGGVGAAPGYGITSGCCCGSNMSMTCGRNACAVFTTKEPAGYCLPATVKGAVARLTLIPTSSNALMNLAAVPKSACDDGMMYPRGSRIAAVCVAAHIAESAAA